MQKVKAEKKNPQRKYCGCKVVRNNVISVSSVVEQELPPLTTFKYKLNCGLTEFRFGVKSNSFMRRKKKKSGERESERKATTTYYYSNRRKAERASQQQQRKRQRQRHQRRRQRQPYGVNTPSKRVVTIYGVANSRRAQIGRHCGQCGWRNILDSST